VEIGGDFLWLRNALGVQMGGRLASGRSVREAHDPSERRQLLGTSKAEGGESIHPQLFDVLQHEAASTPFQAPLGVDADGRAIWLDLHHAASRHLLIENGSQEDRAEMLRALVVGLAATTRPALLQLVTIDPSGRELSVLGTLPHAVTEPASDSASTQVSLSWLASELVARAREGRLWPEMLLVVEDLLGLSRSEDGRARGSLTRILRSGGGWGIHVVGAAANLSAGLKSAGWTRRDVARLASAEVGGWFEFARGGRSTRLTGVRVAAVDLDLVARGRRPSRASASAAHRPGDARSDRWSTKA
jgi:hypothetical protein